MLEDAQQQGFADTDKAFIHALLPQRLAQHNWLQWQDVLQAWLAQMLQAPLSGADLALNALSQVRSELEFWLQSANVNVLKLDALITKAIFPGQLRPPLLSDTLDPQFIHNAARNFEKASWMLAQRTDAGGKPWLLSNEISAEGHNLSYAVEFGKIVARLDLLTDVLDERYRRMGVSYAQGLLFMNFLPVQ